MDELIQDAIEQSVALAGTTVVETDESWSPYSESISLRLADASRTFAVAMALKIVGFRVATEHLGEPPRPEQPWHLRILL